MGVGFGFGLWLWWFIRKIRPTQLWVELSWVVAIKEVGCKLIEIK